MAPGIQGRARPPRVFVFNVTVFCLCTILAAVARADVHYQVVQSSYYENFEGSCSESAIVAAVTAQAPVYLTSRIDTYTDGDGYVCTNNSVVCTAERVQAELCLLLGVNSPTPNCPNINCFQIEPDWGTYVVLHEFLAVTTNAGALPVTISDTSFTDYFGGVNLTVTDASCTEGSPSITMCTNATGTPNCTTTAYAFAGFVPLTNVQTPSFSLLGDTPLRLYCQADLRQPATVLITASIDRVTSINPDTSSFTARYLIALDWDVQELILNGLYSTAAASTGFPITNWLSTISPLTNGDGVTVISSGTYSNAPDTPMRRYTLFAVDGVFTHIYELRSYPFDVHKLEFNVSHGSVSHGTSSEFVVYEVGFYVPPGSTTTEGCYYCTAPAFTWTAASLTPPQGFNVLGSINAAVAETYRVTGSRYDLAIATFAFGVARNPASVYQEIIVVVLTFMLGLAMFALVPGDSNRVLGTMTAFLTIVAFHFVVTASIPITSYLSRMQRFMSLNEAILAALVIYHAILLRLTRFRENHELARIVHRGRESALTRAQRPTTATIELIPQAAAGAGVNYYGTEAGTSGGGMTTDDAYNTQDGATASGFGGYYKKNDDAEALYGEVGASGNTPEDYRKATKLKRRAAWFEANKGRSCLWLRYYWTFTSPFRLVDVIAIITTLTAYTVLSVLVLTTSVYDDTT